jgi:two-component system, cell cycle response regulator DivK
MTRSLPALAEPKSEKPQRRHGSAPPRLPDTQMRTRPRVIIVDDDEDTREMYACSMQAAGWLVEAVADGEEVLFVAPSFAPDVIVMDLRLPGIGGLEATRRLKTNARTSHIPIVACSGLDRFQVETPARRAGCEEFVAKPCPPTQLRALLVDLVAGRRRSST